MPEAMPDFPWYDSPWLSSYVRAKAWITRAHPARLAEFEARLAPLRTDPAFEAKGIPQVFDEGTLHKIRDAIRSLKAAQLELHEARDFGRFIVHDHRYFVELQRGLAGLVSEQVGEQVEPSYNFLSLYSRTGVCGVHLDAPSAKWTLDVCVEQSIDWPIYFSQVVPWPEDNDYTEPGWQARIKSDPSLRFTSHSLKPGSALAFSGSSQWHFRDPLPRAPGSGNFSNLLFFHFIPRGTAEWVEPQRWPVLLGLPELGDIIGTFSGLSPGRVQSVAPETLSPAKLR
jgi:hypothetical protein